MCTALHVVGTTSSVSILIEKEDGFIILGMHNRAGEIPKFFENSLLKPLNGQPILGQCKENWFESQ